MTPFVTLGVDQDVFAVPVAQVQEILDFGPLSRLPHSPAEIAGLIDVRGRSVAVVDLRAKLGLAVAEATDATRILILDLGPAAPNAFGLLADRVYEVSEFETGRLEPPPRLGLRWKADYIDAIGRWRDGFVIVLHLGRLLMSDHLASDPAALKGLA